MGEFDGIRIECDRQGLAVRQYLTDVEPSRRWTQGEALQVEAVPRAYAVHIRTPAVKC